MIIRTLCSFMDRLATTVFQMSTAHGQQAGAGQIMQVRLLLWQQTILPHL